MSTPTSTPSILVACNPSGLKIRGVPALRSVPLTEEVINSPAFRNAYTAVKKRIDKGEAFDGIRQATVEVQVLEDEFVLHCQPLPYSKAISLMAYSREKAQSGKAPALFPLSQAPAGTTGIMTAVLTSEGLALVSQRSSKVGIWPDCWSAGFGEGLEAEDLSRDNLFHAAARCVHEELGVALDEVLPLESRYRALALVRDNETNTWDTHSLLDFRGLDPRIFGADALIRSSLTAKDGWENSQVIAMPLPEAARHLRSVKTVPDAVELIEYVSTAASLPGPALR